MAFKTPSYEQQEIFVRPMCLISNEPGGKIKVEPDVLDQIRKIYVPVVVVGIVGLYRTGKSYLMNRLAEKSEGFPLGRSIRSKTKGIWAWCIRHPKRENTVLLLLDTEGLGDVKKGDGDNDNRIFTLAALLSNVLIYNVMSAFNQDIVEKLTFISEISQRIRFKNRSQAVQENDQLDLILPIFVLCVRDFTLDLEDEDEKELSPDEYLEDCLELLPAKEPNAVKYNAPRESIRKFFPTRKCFTFEVPCLRTDMKHLEKLALNQLSKAFREETERFLEYIYSRQPKVLLCSKPLNGGMFATLVETYVNAISNGEVPDVDDAISVVAHTENERLAKSIIQRFRCQLDTVKLPQLSTRKFDEMYNSYQSQLLKWFREEAMFDEKKVEARIIDDMNKVWNEKTRQNTELIKQYCQQEINTIYKDVVGEDTNKYHKSGGYAKYRADLGNVKLEYMKKMENADQLTVEGVLTAFMTKEIEKENQILMVDQEMSQKERQNEIERVEKESKEAQQRQQDSFERHMKIQKERSEKQIKKLEDDRKAREKQDEAKLQDLMREWQKKRDLTDKEMKAMRDDNEQLKNQLKNVRKKADEDVEKKYQELSNQLNKQLKESNDKIVALTKALDDAKNNPNNNERKIEELTEKIKKMEQSQTTTTPAPPTTKTAEPDSSCPIL